MKFFYLSLLIHVSSINNRPLYCTYISICMCVGALSKWLLIALPISEKPKLAWLEFQYFGIILKLALLEFRYFGIISKLAWLEFRYFSIISKLALLEFRYFDIILKLAWLEFQYSKNRYFSVFQYFSVFKKSLKTISVFQYIDIRISIFPLQNININ